MGACKTQIHDLHAARPAPLTTEALRRIAERYVIEAEIRGKPPDERKAVRQPRSRPLLDDLGRWLRTALDQLSRKSDAAAAIRYTLNLWPALLRYCDDGAVEIDNSAKNCYGACSKSTSATVTRVKRPTGRARPVCRQVGPVGGGSRPRYRCGAGAVTCLNAEDRKSVV